MRIFQPDRHLLEKEIKSVAYFISGKVLDAGAGEFNRYGSFFKEAQEHIRLDSRSDNVDVSAPIENIPFGAGEFDSVICTQVLEHIPEPYLAVRELARVLKPGGKILITVPQASELHEEPYDYFRYTIFGLEKMLEKEEFRIIYKKQRGGFFSLIAQMVIRYLIDTFHLYKNTVGRLLAPLIAGFGHTAVWLDEKNKSVANRKHAIGWLVVAEKK